jgi:hypothetical protein
MGHIILLDWSAEDVETHAQRIRRGGHDVESVVKLDRAGMLNLRKSPPDAFVVGLDRRPAQGRDLAIWLRQQKATRHVPIVFAGGDPEKTKQIRKLLPDAVHTEWSRIRGALRRAIEQAPQHPTVPGTMDSYAGTPLPKKLGIRTGTTVALAGAPTGFARTLGRLPDGVRLMKQLRGRPDVLLLFVKSQADLNRRFPAAARALADRGKLWIVWPKKASGVSTDLTQNTVRAFGLAADFVDYKISAIDETWSGLCFARRRK